MVIMIVEGKIIIDLVILKKMLLIHNSSTIGSCYV